jgi:hypothetical protein
MKGQKKSALIISVVFALMLLAAAFLLVRGIMQFNDSEAKLDVAKKRLKGLYDEKPFPSQQNVGRINENVNLLNEWYQKLTVALRKGQIDPMQKSPSTFMSLLQTNELRKANVSGKVVGDNFGFGFERYYTSSALPEPNDVPRLTQQLMIVEKLCAVIFAEKIDKLISITREEFEEGAVPEGAGGQSPASGMGRGIRGGGTRSAGPATAVRLVNKSAGLMGEEDLFAKFHFIIEFKGRESVLWGVLNKFAAHEMFIVVTGVTVAKEGSDVTDIKAKTTSSAATAEAPPAVPGAAVVPATQVAGVPVSAVEKPALLKSTEKPSRAERIVCGPEMEKAMTMKIELDVYRFRGE